VDARQDLVLETGFFYLGNVGGQHVDIGYNH
jgi:hypothetical protein